ncbi:GNAT family N-acetyltransferase [Staphylococcus lutrae]|uniref:GNAT family N-acetyltransferase n=1 Tax=Staphylococcus lutrae TaxID=155085 RepID=A0AAC9RUX6_9STAP|nr:GNAT family N-acetyltransferase [Staphylococcus lutrae]ARJ51485.1 GNAT family N-acetyltransferase [Staphylococcus lutrae]PNZ38674.1 GNAT family N-acetyltransferase [Staphylococcus lutrae]
MFKKVENEQEYQDVLKIRKTVFIQEQGVSEEEEIDKYEKTAHYFIAYNDAQQPVGTARYRDVDGSAKIERVAVLKSTRGQGIGKQLMQTLEEEAAQQGFRHFKLGAQTHAVPFYESLGYHTYGEEFMDAGMPHFNMEKHI